MKRTGVLRTDLNEENWSLQDEAELGELEFTGMRGIGVYGQNLPDIICPSVIEFNENS